MILLSKFKKVCVVMLRLSSPVLKRAGGLGGLVQELYCATTVAVYCRPHTSPRRVQAPSKPLQLSMNVPFVLTAFTV